MLINKLYTGDSKEVLSTLPDQSIHCCVTSPPYYGLRDYGMDGQIGLEESPEAYISRLVDVFREVSRTLKDDGTLWVNIGDSYAGGAGRWGGNKNMSDKQNSSKGSISQIEVAKKWEHDTIKPKDLIGIPWMLAFALRADGWYLRQDIIWSKPNPMPESVKDRCTKSHEYIFMLSKSKGYYFDHEAIMEEANYDGRQDTRMKGSHKYSQGTTGLNPQTFSARGHERWIMKDGRYMRNKRDVWNVCAKPFREAHFAVFPPELIIDCIKAGCPENGVVLDPFFGSGTTGVVARKLNRNYIGIELNPKYVEIAENRIYKELGCFK